MGKINTKGIKLYLDLRTKNDLIEEIINLYSEFNNVKNYFDEKLNKIESKDLLQKYKNIIKNKCFPFGQFTDDIPNITIGEKAISDFIRVTGSKDEVIDLMFYYLEKGIDFSKEYGYADELFIFSLEKMYKNAIRNIKRYKLKKTYFSKCKKVGIELSTIGCEVLNIFSELTE